MGPQPAPPAGKIQFQRGLSDGGWELEERATKNPGSAVLGVGYWSETTDSMMTSADNPNATRIAPTWSGFRLYCSRDG